MQSGVVAVVMVYDSVWGCIALFLSCLSRWLFLSFSRATQPIVVLMRVLMCVLMRILLRMPLCVPCACCCLLRLRSW